LKTDNLKDRQEKLMPFSFQIFNSLQKSDSLNKLTLNSKAATEIPDAAPVPDNPMKCSLPMLLANREAPT
jgi:hypothetical protein